MKWRSLLGKYIIFYVRPRKYVITYMQDSGIYKGVDHFLPGLF